MKAMICLIGLASFLMTAEEAYDGMAVIAPVQVAPIGPVQEHVPLSVTMKVFNPLTTPFSIARIDAGCACVVATPENVLIPVGGHVPISVKIDNVGKSGDTTAEIFIVPRDEQSSPLVARFHYQVLGNVTVDQIVDRPAHGPCPRPNEGELRNLYSLVIDPSWGKVLDTTFTFRIGSDRPPAGGLVVQRVDCPSPWTSRLVPQGDGTFLVDLFLPGGSSVPTAPRGSMRIDKLVITTNHPDKPMVNIDIQIIPLGGLSEYFQPPEEGDKP